ncbi:hypothetical protein GCM10009097_50950 [Pigmentiphaga daeguensis]|uniref:Uncharacterized protein n=1 Tax=Pigmentiphaga daeguensis TaxID=414049 RepID=A0ABP3MT43_9BURK
MDLEGAEVEHALEHGVLLPDRFRFDGAAFQAHDEFRRFMGPDEQPTPDLLARERRKQGDERVVDLDEVFEAKHGERGSRKILLRIPRSGAPGR